MEGVPSWSNFIAAKRTIGVGIEAVRYHGDGETPEQAALSGAVAQPLAWGDNMKVQPVVGFLFLFPYLSAQVVAVV